MILKIYNNLLWDLLDDESKLNIITLSISKGFVGEIKLKSIIRDNVTVMIVEDEKGEKIELPIEILDILMSLGEKTIQIF